MSHSSAFFPQDVAAVLARRHAEMGEPLLAQSPAENCEVLQIGRHSFVKKFFFFYTNVKKCSMFMHWFGYQHAFLVLFFSTHWGVIWINFPNRTMKAFGLVKHLYLIFTRGHGFMFDSRRFDQQKTLNLWTKHVHSTFGVRKDECHGLTLINLITVYKWDFAWFVFECCW